MQISRRLRSLAPSATLAVNAKAAELRAAGVQILSFAAGEPDFDAPEPLKRAVREALDAKTNAYVPTPGDAETRAVIARKLNEENQIPGVTPDHVVVCSGGKHALYELFQALLDDHDDEIPGEVLLPTPAWVSYDPQIRLAGGTVVELPTTAAEEFKLSPERLEAAITARTRAIVINSPSNPCGTMYSPDELRALAAVIARKAASEAPHLVVISDELYEKIIFGEHEHFSIGSLAEVADRTITVNGLSKAYAITGWRLGYLAGVGEFGLEVAMGVRKLQSQSTTSVASLLLPAVRAAITECADDVERMRRAFAARAEVAYARVRDIPGLECPRPTGAFYLFPDITAHFGTTSPGGREIGSSLDFCAALLEEAHIAVVPGEGFGSGGERCFRFTFACGEDQIRQGLDGIDAFVRSLR
jgi:aspartate aminotransferase